jgi:hypothetical protein
MGGPEAAKPATAAIGEPASNVERVAALDIHAHTPKLSLVQVRRVRRFRAIDNPAIWHHETRTDLFRADNFAHKQKSALRGGRS